MATTLCVLKSLLLLLHKIINQMLRPSKKTGQNRQKKINWVKVIIIKKKMKFGIAQKRQRKNYYEEDILLVFVHVQ